MVSDKIRKRRGRPRGRALFSFAGTSWEDGNYSVAFREEDVVKDLRSLLADLSSSWLKRRKTQALKTTATVKAAPRLAEQATRQCAAHKPKPPSTRDVASNM